MPNVIFEALACGTPTVATNVGGIVYLPKGVLLTCPPRDRIGLFNAVEKVLNGDFKIDELQRNLLLSECSFRNISMKLKGIMEEVSSKYV
jgi:glycosyltransferase involved in cell wall biosynthesis